jgi:hypothetical protein
LIVAAGLMEHRGMADATWLMQVDPLTFKTKGELS